MTTRFLLFASVNGFLLVASYVLGWVSRLQDGAHRELSVYITHFAVGLLTALLTLLVHSIIFTYFLGTGRWVKEVGIAYKLPDQLLPKQTRELKRRVFPPALFAMLIVIAAAAAGQGAQMGMWHWSIHMTVATLTLLINGWAYRVEYRCLAENAVILESVMREVERIRAKEGLPTNAEALLEQETLDEPAIRKLTTDLKTA